MIRERKLFFAVLTVSSVLQCLALQYDPAKIYSYSYKTDVLLNEANSKKATQPQQDVGVHLSLSLDLSTVYKNDTSQMFKLSITQAKAARTSRPNVQKDLDGSLLLPILFQLKGDIVEYLHYASTESTFSLNVKKGIVAIFQVQDKPGRRTELDVSGECEVAYTAIKPDQIMRTKTDCKNLEIASQFSNTNKALGVSMYTKSSQHYKMKDSIIEQVSGTQRIIAYLNFRSALNGAAQSSQNLQLESQRDGSSLAVSAEEAVKNVETETGSEYTLTLLPSEEEIQQCTEGCTSPKSQVANLSEDLKAENIATIKSAKAFVQLLKSFRESGKKTLEEVLTSLDSYYIVPQLIDVATAAQTEASKEALFNLLDFEDADTIIHPQRFLFAVAYSSHPSESLINDLLSILNKSVPNISLRESLLLSLGAIVNTFCQVKDQCSLNVVSEFKALVTSELSKCEEEQCQLMYLRAIGNAGLASTVSVILKYVESHNSSPMVSSTAISAFRRIPERFITKEVKESMLRVFHQNKAAYDSSVRLAALEFLLDNQPSEQVIRNVLLSCLNQNNAEFSTYVIKLLLVAASTNPSTSSKLAAVLQDSHFNNYNILSQNGKSSVITSTFAEMKDMNGTYNLYFENSPSRVVKQSGMIVSLLGKTIKQPVLKFGIYAANLESVVGEAPQESDVGETADASEASDDGKASVEPTAGLAFTFMDVFLTQVEFFRGMSGLMAAAWSAPSELTSALQANLLLQDHSIRFHLSNGLVLDSRVVGALSLDLSGSISISLWNRNCESLIRTSAAVYIEGSLGVQSKELDIGVIFAGEGESNIDFTGKADFYEMPLKLCMQMKRPDFQFTQRVEKLEKLGKRKVYKSHSSVKNKIPGESYLLNKANSEECRVMLKEDQ